jgi:hypothetical protein
MQFKRHKIPKRIKRNGNRIIHREYSFYNSSNLNKRMMNMLIERLKKLSCFEADSIEK